LLIIYRYLFIFFPSFRITFHKRPVWITKEYQKNNRFASHATPLCYWI